MLGFVTSHFRHSRLPERCGPKMSICTIDEKMEGMLIVVVCYGAGNEVIHSVYLHQLLSKPIATGGSRNLQLSPRPHHSPASPESRSKAPVW